MSKAALDAFEIIARRYRERAARALTAYLPPPTDATAAEGIAPQRLQAAMRYACLPGGKRLRAMLVYGCGELAGADLRQLDAPAAAVECMHAYSLVHDDLPAMDDDALRRGQPACHVKFDEATAILAGDALQTLAFEILATAPDAVLSAARKLEMTATLARAAGAAGMAGGQSLDSMLDAPMESGLKLELDDLTRVHQMKTAALIRAAARLGGYCAPAVSTEMLAKLDAYAAHLGLAFQILDDVLDATDGADARLQKTTFVSKIGREPAAARARDCAQQAVAIIAELGDNSAFLQRLAQFAVERSF